ncbi:MAG: hypothetical protein JJV98_02660 [Desulfosarcina sp.]|nr:hypothetical protein [Desulfobacterales bacterium]
MGDSDYDQQRDDFVERMLRSARGTFETFTIYMGHRLGYYAVLSDARGATVAELAAVFPMATMARICAMGRPV